MDFDLVVENGSEVAMVAKGNSKTGIAVVVSTMVAIKMTEKRKRKW